MGEVMDEFSNFFRRRFADLGEWFTLNTSAEEEKDGGVGDSADEQDDLEVEDTQELFGPNINQQLRDRIRGRNAGRDMVQRGEVERSPKMKSRNIWASHQRTRFEFDTNEKDGLIKKKLMDELIEEQISLRDHINLSNLTHKKISSLSIGDVVVSLGLFRFYSDLAVVADQLRCRRNFRIAKEKDFLDKHKNTEEWSRLPGSEKCRIEQWAGMHQNDTAVTLTRIATRYIPCFLTMRLDNMHLGKYKTLSAKARENGEEYGRINLLLNEERFSLELSYEDTVNMTNIVSQGLHPNIVAMTRSFNDIYSRFCNPKKQLPCVIDDVKLTCGAPAAKLAGMTHMQFRDGKFGVTMHCMASSPSKIAYAVSPQGFGSNLVSCVTQLIESVLYKVPLSERRHVTIILLIDRGYVTTSFLRDIMEKFNTTRIQFVTTRQNDSLFVYCTTTTNPRYLGDRVAVPSAGPKGVLVAKMKPSGGAEALKLPTERQQSTTVFGYCIREMKAPFLMQTVLNRDGDLAKILDPDRLVVQPRRFQPKTNVYFSHQTDNGNEDNDINNDRDDDDDDDVHFVLLEGLKGMKMCTTMQRSVEWFGFRVGTITSSVVARVWRKFLSSDAAHWYETLNGDAKMKFKDSVEQTAVRVLVNPQNFVQVVESECRFPAKLAEIMN